MARGDKSMAEITAAANQEMQHAEGRRKKLVQEFQGEPKVPMYLSPMYRPYFGRIMQVSINGITIAFPVDGSTQMIPQTFADEIASRRIAVDEILNKQSRMANITANHESTPGELVLF